MTASLPALLHRTRDRDGERQSSVMALPGFDAAEIAVIGSVEAISHQERKTWLAELRRVGSEPNGTLKSIHLAHTSARSAAAVVQSAA